MRILKAKEPLAGTIVGATGADIVSGGKTIILTVTPNQLVPAARFDAQRQNIINNLTSARIRKWWDVRKFWDRWFHWTR